MLQGCLCQQFLSPHRIWNSLPLECFHLTYDLSGFKSRINRHFNCRFFLNIFPICCNLFVLLFLVTPCLIVAVQPCMEWITIKKSGVHIISSASVGIASASFNFMFSLITGIIKKFLSIRRIKKKKHDEILMLAKSKLNSIETLVSQALIDMEISHEEFNMRGQKKTWGMSVKNKKIWDWIVWIQEK